MLDFRSFETREPQLVFSAPQQSAKQPEEFSDVQSALKVSGDRETDSNGVDWMMKRLREGVFHMPESLSWACASFDWKSW